MEKQILKSEGVSREVEIFFTNEELKPYFDKAYRELQPKVEIKGFRKGHVPVPILKQRFGNEIKQDVIEDAATEFFKTYTAEENIKPVSQPFIKDLKDEDNGIRITVVFEVLPEFELADYRGLTIDEPFHSVNDEEIEHEILHVLIHESTREPAEQITDDMYEATLHWQKLDESTGLPLLGAEDMENKIFLHEHNIIPELKALLLNLKVDDTFRFVPSDYNKNSPAGPYVVTVKSIEKVVLPELTNEFVKNMTNGELETAEDYKAEIGFKIQEEWNKRSREEMEMQIVNKLVDMHDFEVPGYLVYKFVELMLDDTKKRYKEAEKLKVQDVYKNYEPTAIRQVKWDLIREEIIKKEKIEVEDYDIDEMAEKTAAMLGMDANILKSHIRNNEELQNSILNKKVLDLIIDYAVTNEVPFEEYNPNFKEDQEEILEDIADEIDINKEIDEITDEESDEILEDDESEEEESEEEEEEEK